MKTNQFSIANIYIGWCILVIIYLIIRYKYFKSTKLSKDQYIIKLNELGYTDSNSLINEIELNVRKIKDELSKKYTEGYNQANCSYCNLQINSRSSCIYNCKENAGQIFKQNSYNLLSDNDKKKIKYYDLYSMDYTSKIIKEGFLGFIGIPMISSIFILILIADSKK